MILDSEKNFQEDPRFAGIKRFEEKVWLSSPTMHGEERHWVDDAIVTNWVSTVGENINVIEKECAETIGRKYAVALGAGTAALHLAIRLAGERLYGKKPVHVGTLSGKKVFCSDCTFDATVNPVAYEGGEAVFIDTEEDSWNMSPEALRTAFKRYPDVKLIVLAHLYGTPGKCEEIRAIADEHGAMIVEDAAESFGATYKGVQTGMFGDISVISFNGNKIITGSSGGMILTDSKEEADRIRKWSTQSREPASWYQHEDLGYNYRMSNIVAGVIRGQLGHLNEHIAQKKAVYYRYKEGLKDLPVTLNPVPDYTEPNYWLSCLIINKEAMGKQVRTDLEARYEEENGKSTPTEILAALAAFNIEGRPIWKPMHMQPIYKEHDFVIAEGKESDFGSDLFARGLCLPSDNKMTEKQQNVVIDIIHRCFGVPDWKPETVRQEKRNIKFNLSDIGQAECRDVDQVLLSGWITTGYETKKFEKKIAAYIETGKVTENADEMNLRNNVVCLNSATAAEELNLRVLGIGPGDEVIVPAFTYTATASAVVHCGAEVKFVDIRKNGSVDSHAPEFDYDALENAITERTKAIVAVDYGGIVCNYDRIYEAVRKKKDLFRPKEKDGTPLGDLSAAIQKGIGTVAVVSDCAHSIGASRVVSYAGQDTFAPTRKNCGQIAHFTSFSFHAVKNLTTGEGGASTWLPVPGVDDEDIYQMLQLLSLHGQSKDAFSKTQRGEWEYDVIGPWYKTNMTDIMAAIGIRQLVRYEDMLSKRAKIVEKYDSLCDGLGIDHLHHHTAQMESAMHLYPIRINGLDERQRNEFMAKMKERGISTNVHYKPLPMMTAYKQMGWDIEDFPNSYDYYRNLITLPLYSRLTDEDVEYICGVLKEVWTDDFKGVE